jgi:hypothetical protein
VAKDLQAGRRRENGTEEAHYLPPNMN